jgi:beta-carotene hydroxylase
MSSAQDPRLPPLGALGRDLLHVPGWRVAVSLATPFALAGAFFVAAGAGWRPAAIGCMVALSFSTYGSISHDLVHRALGLPRWWNEFFLTAIELLVLRSGRAYRLAHLNHHSHYPDPGDDPEAAAAHGGPWRALVHGPPFIVRLWCWALQRHPAHRPRLLAEGAAILVLALAAVLVAVCGGSVVPLVYVGLAHLGTWVVPLVTACRTPPVATPSCPRRAGSAAGGSGSSRSTTCTTWNTTCTRACRTTGGPNRPAGSTRTSTAPGFPSSDLCCRALFK